MCIFFENIGKNITSHFKNHFFWGGGGRGWGWGCGENNKINIM